MSKRSVCINFTVGLAVSACLWAGTTVTPAFADPVSIEQVRTQISELEIQSAAAAERLNGAKLELEQSQQRLALFSRQAATSRIDLARQQRLLEQLARQLYVNGGFGGSLLSFSLDDPEGFLRGLDQLTIANASQSSVVKEARALASSLKSTTDALAREQQRLSTATANLAAEQANADAAIAQLQSELAKLEEQQRAALLAEAAAAQTASIGQSQQVLLQLGQQVSDDRIAAVLSYALAQVGKGYVLGSPGPDTFDCSGLTRAAWAQAGVRLSHYSGAQYRETVPIALDQLQPGDLLYFYHINQHVGLYIGNGVFVHAANPRSGVLTATLDSYYRSHLVAASRPVLMPQ